VLAKLSPRRPYDQEDIMHRSLTKVVAQAVIVGASILGTAIGGHAEGFLETDLVANKSPLADSNGVVHKAPIQDPNLLNPWGLTASPTSPFWVSDNGAGVSTLYNTTGTPQSLIVLIPAPADALGRDGTPTGAVFNTAAAQGAFQVSGIDISGAPITRPATFLFATEDGTILGWNAAVFPREDLHRVSPNTHAIIAVDHSMGGAVYKGIAIATDALGTNRLYVTNFHAGTVEIFDAGFAPATPFGAFADPHLPRNYAPFNIVLVGGRLVVTFAVQDADKRDDVAGMSHGIVDTFDLGGQSFQRLIQHGQLNSPWGVAVAPASFGTLAGSLLIGNFGNGHINAYNPTTGEFIDKMRDSRGQAIAIDGLWSLRVGNGGNGGKTDTVYFTAGPNDEKDGLFGSLAPN
jgi:uncharacterized protein (TIGR03118 family)